MAWSPVTPLNKAGGGGMMSWRGGGTRSYSRACVYIGVTLIKHSGRPERSGQQPQTHSLGAVLHRQIPAEER